MVYMQPLSLKACSPMKERKLDELVESENVESDKVAEQLLRSIRDANSK